MPEPLDITPSTINEWLTHHKRTREWLAAQLGVSLGTVGNWLAPNTGKPMAAPTLKLIERLMCDDLLGETQYSYQEAKIIRHAMDQEGYKSLRDFVRDAVTAHARSMYRIWRKNVGAGFEKAVHHLDVVGAVAHYGEVPDDVKKESVPVIHPYPKDHFGLQLAGRIPGRAEDGSILVVKPRGSSSVPTGSLIICKRQETLEVWELVSELPGNAPDGDAIVADQFSSRRPLKGSIEGVVVDVI